MSISAASKISRPPVSGGLVVSESDKKKKKDLLDHAAHYVNTSDGAWDFFRVSALVSKSLNQPQVGAAADFAGGALAIPFVIKNIKDVRDDIRAYKDAKHLSLKDPTREEKIRAATKKGVMDGCTGLNNATMGALCLNDAKIVDLGKSLPVVGTIYNATTLVTDTSDGIDQCKRLIGYHELKQTATKAQKQFLPSLTGVAVLKLIKAVSSVALAIICLSAIFFTTAVTSLSCFLPVTFALGTIWLTTSLIGYFSNEIVKENMAHAKVTIEVKV